MIPGTWEVLWTVLYSTLVSLYIKPAHLIRDKALSQEKEPGALQISKTSILVAFQRRMPQSRV
ncbi:hypothetical protein DFH28DRAFT_978029 [Melampsora americana]|nr:hypothetical protein DFH28DRAFT_978029 [Melampsora americana]